MAGRATAATSRGRNQGRRGGGEEEGDGAHLDETRVGRTGATAAVPCGEGVVEGRERKVVRGG
jgi:hypothetical protein